MSVIKDLRKGWTNALTLSIVTFVMAISAVASTAIGTPSAAAAVSQNSIDCIKKNAGDKAFVKYNGNNTVTAHFKVPKACGSTRITFVVYRVNDGNWHNAQGNQEIFHMDSSERPAGFDKNVTLATPNTCAWQADLLIGPAANLMNGEHQSAHLGNPASAVGNVGVPCKPQQTTTTTTPTTPAETPTVTPTATATATSESTAIATSTPAETTTVSSSEDTSDLKNAKELPNTGPGSVAAIFAGVSSVSALAYHLVVRRLGFIG